MPHRTYGCVVNSPHNRTCGARAVHVRCTCGMDFLVFIVFFLLLVVSKIEVSDKKNTGFNEERVLSVCTGSADKI